MIRIILKIKHKCQRNENIINGLYVFGNINLAYTSTYSMSKKSCQFSYSDIYFVERAFTIYLVFN